MIALIHKDIKSFTKRHLVYNIGIHTKRGVHYLSKGPISPSKSSVFAEILSLLHTQLSHSTFWMCPFLSVYFSSTLWLIISPRLICDRSMVKLARIFRPNSELSFCSPWIVKDGQCSGMGKSKLGMDLFTKNPVLPLVMTSKLWKFERCAERNQFQNYVSLWSKIDTASHETWSQNPVLKPGTETRSWP